MGTRHFSQMFRAPREATIEEVLCTARTIPQFVCEEDLENLKKRVMLGEIDVVVKCFIKEKSTWLDGWPIEFYLTFFYHIGKDILMESEDCRLLEDVEEV